MFDLYNKLNKYSNLAKKCNQRQSIDMRMSSWQVG